MSIWREFLSNREGATAVEYGIVVASSVGCWLPAFSLMSDNLLAMFNYLATFLKA